MDFCWTSLRVQRSKKNLVGNFKRKQETLLPAGLNRKWVYNWKEKGVKGEWRRGLLWPESAVGKNGLSLAVPGLPGSEGTCSPK